MHEDQADHFVGSSNELIVIDSSTPTSGVLSLELDGVALGQVPQRVAFSSTDGVTKKLIATLTGPPRSQCSVSIATVDNAIGGVDKTILFVREGASEDEVEFEFFTAATATSTFMAAASAKTAKPKKTAVTKKAAATKGAF